jgi:hypothetical protein
VRRAQLEPAYLDEPGQRSVGEVAFPAAAQEAR